MGACQCGVHGTIYCENCTLIYSTSSRGGAIRKSFVHNAGMSYRRKKCIAQMREAEQKRQAGIHEHSHRAILYWFVKCDT